VSYTCNLSLGDTPTQLANKQGLAHSLANLILSLNLAKAHTDADHPVPAGYVINPDFLGACQQGGFAPEYAMPVREPLRMALDHWNVQATIPDSIEENIRGYVAAVNWLIRTVAPAVTFGWQVNLWGVGASEWIYASGDEPMDNAPKTAAYVRAMRVHEGPYAPDFLAVDRYEADDFTIRSYANGYCYWTHEWDRFYDFCAELSRDLKFPIMPWQIPASHAPLVSDPVNDNFDTQNWGTGGTYIFGDPAIGGTITTSTRRSSPCRSPRRSTRRWAATPRPCSRARSRSTSACRPTATSRTVASSRCCWAAAPPPASSPPSVTTPRSCATSSTST